MKIAHLSDLHFCTKHLDWIKVAMDYALTRISEQEIDAIVISGDIFDRALGLHDPAVEAFMEYQLALADLAPVANLQGTFTHDQPGCLNPFKNLPTKYPICVADEPCQMLLQAGEWRRYEGLESMDGSTDGDALFSFLPSLNLGDPAVMKLGPRGYVEAMLVGFEEANREAAEHSRPLPTILVSHGTVTGSLTESNHALVSPDHEFTTDMLFQSGADATMLGHIHKAQDWESYRTLSTPNTTQRIAYPGSIARLVHGDHNKKGWLLWDVSPGKAQFEFIESPTRQLLEVEFPGIPDMDQLRELAQQARPEDSVRVRWSVDQESQHLVDTKTIADLFAHCDSLQAQGTLLRVSSVRSEGISRKKTLGEKLDAWLGTTGDEDQKLAMATLLQLVQTKEAQEILADITAEFTGRVGAALQKETIR